MISQEYLLPYYCDLGSLIWYLHLHCYIGLHQHLLHYFQQALCPVLYPHIPALSHLLALHLVIMFLYRFHHHLAFQQGLQVALYNLQLIPRFLHLNLPCIPEYLLLHQLGTSRHFLVYPFQLAAFLGWLIQVC